MKTIEIPHPYETWAEFFASNPQLIENPPMGANTKVIFDRGFGTIRPDMVLLFDLLLLATKEKTQSFFNHQELDILIRALRFIRNDVRQMQLPDDERSITSLLDKMYALKDRQYQLNRSSK